MYRQQHDPHNDDTDSISKDTYNRILTQIIVRSTSDGVQVHQVLKVADLTLNPFLHNNIKYNTLNSHRLIPVHH